MKAPTRVGIIGLGGFAGAHHRALLDLELEGAARVLCTCDPAAAHFTAQREEFRLVERGIPVFTDYRQMLDAFGDRLDVLVVPTPIPLHEEMHRAGVERGIAVYLEKPPTLDHLELERMIRCDQRARHATFVGFNFIIEPTRLALKQRLLAGEFGTLQEAHLLGRWPRPTSYFSRNDWAGRLRAPDGRVVLDSVLGNAMSHYVHNLLFWAGAPELMNWATLETVQARLFRAYDIEGTDTFFTTARTTDGVRMRFALTHTHTPVSTHRETLVCAHATLDYQVGAGGKILWHNGVTEPIAPQPFDALKDNHRAYFDYVRDEADRPATRLEDCRPFVMLNNLAYISSGAIYPFPAEQVATHRDEREQIDYRTVAGLTDTQDAFLATGAWPAGLGAPADEPDATTAADLPKFHSTIERLAPARE